MFIVILKMFHLPNCNFPYKSMFLIRQENKDANNLTENFVRLQKLERRLI